NGCSPRRASPDCAVSAMDTRYPSVFRRSSSPSRISASSSTTRMEPLDMNRFPHRRKLHVEGRAAPRRGTHINLPGMFLDDPVAHGQAQTRAAASWLGGEKGIENLMDVIARDPVAR